ncbi:MAG: COG4315 family predicted lipoprotein [Frankiaceae bacterium]
MDQRRRSLRRAAMWAAPVALLAATAAACGRNNSTSSASPASSAPAAAPSAAGAVATVTTSNGSLGTFLTAGDGRTLYLFEKDTSATSTCTGACAVNWPPLVTTGAPQAAGQAQAGMLATSPRPDGTTQVTYAGHPMYLFAGDKAPGSTLGQGINAFGAEWYVVAPSGQKIESTPGSSSSSTGSTTSSGGGY